MESFEEVGEFFYFNFSGERETEDYKERCSDSLAVMIVLVELVFSLAADAFPGRAMLVE